MAINLKSIDAGMSPDYHSLDYMRKRRSVDVLPRAVVALAALLVVAAVGYPMLALLLECARPEAWRAVAEIPFLAAAARNTLAVSVVSSAASVCLAGALAFLAARTDLPAKPLLWAAALSPFLLSQSVTAIAWIVLAERRGGLLNVALRSLGARWSFEILSLPGIAFATTLLTLPASFLILEAMTRSLDADLEEAAFLCGASPGQTLRRVVGPLLWPGVAAAGLLCFMLANVMFSVQGLLGMPRSIWTLANLVYFSLSTFPSDLPAAAALCFCLLAAGLLVLWAQRRLLAGRSFAVLSGKRRPAATWRLSPRSKAAALACVAALFTLTVVLPYGALLWRSLAPENVQVQEGPRAWLSGLSFDGYRALLADAAMRRGLLNSLALAGGAALACLALAGVLAGASARARGRLARLLPVICVAPFAFSGMVLGLGFILAFSGPPLRLYGSLWLLWIAYTVRELAVAFKVVQASLSQVSPDLEEAALLCGAGPLYTARRVLGPLMRSSLAGAGVLVFLAAYREIETSVLLAGPGREVFGYQLFNGFQDGTWRQISALALAGAAVCAAAAATAGWVIRRGNA